MSSQLGKDELRALFPFSVASEFELELLARKTGRLQARPGECLLQAGANDRCLHIAAAALAGSGLAVAISTTSAAVAS